MDMMQEAIASAFGNSVTEALQPMFDRVHELTLEVIHLRNDIVKLQSAQTELLGVINVAKSKGGFAAKMLGG